jgi:hypothetical protein
MKVAAATPPAAAVVIRVQLKVPESDWGRNNGEQRITQ